MKSIRLRRGLLVGILSIVILLIAAADLNAQSPCGCEDVPDLINQLNIANATLAKLDQFEESIRPELGATVTTHGSRFSSELAKLIAAINNPKAKAASGETSSVSCAAKIEASTPCLDSIIRLREGVNQEFCIAAFKDAYNRREKFEGNDRKSRWPMQTFIYEQRKAYQAEVAEVERILRGLPAKCRPGDWYGTITVIEEIHNRVVIGRESSDDRATRTGTIAFNGDSTPLKRSYWQLEAKFVNENSGGGTRACTGGLATSVQDGTYTTSDRLEINKSGATPEATEITIGDPDEDMKTQVSFYLGAVISKVSGQKVSIRRGSCPGDTSTETTSITRDDDRFDREPVNVAPKIIRGAKTDPEKIQGTESMTVMCIPTKNGEMCHRIKVKFQLYRR